jgi:hypothetical protein
MSKKQIILFILILLLASFLRLFKLGEIPKYLNRDEASLGYTAFSILKTGHEEHGKLIPINIESFGDWKLPGYIYASIPLINVYGLNAFSIRLLASLSGIGIVILSFLISKKIFKNSSIALIVAFLVGMAPWAIHMSRIAYEANLALLLFLLGFYSYLLGKSRPKFLILTSFSFVLAVFTYHAYQVFIPAFTLFLLIQDKNKLIKILNNNKKVFLVCVAMIFLGIFLLFFEKSNSAISTKFSGLSIFENSSLFDLIKNTINNFFTLFSFEFLVKSGGSNTAHNISSFGNIYLSTLILAVTSFLSLIKQKNTQIKFFGIWILIASLAPMLTNEANHTIRASSMFIAWEILAAYSVYYLFKNKKLKLLFGILFILCFYLTSYLHRYFLVAPIIDTDRFDWYMKDIALYIDQEKNNYQTIYFNAASSSPYIYYLFYTQYDPEKLLSNIEYFPADKEGFRHVAKLDNIIFVNYDFNDIEQKQSNILFILRDKEVSQDKKENKRYEMVGSLKNPYSKYKYQFWHLD